MESTNVGNYNPLRAKIVYEGESLLLIEGGPVLSEDGGPLLLVDGGPVLLEDGGPLLLEYGRPLLLEDDGLLFRGNFHGTQWIQDDRGVSEDALGSGKGGGSCSIASCNNEDRFTL
jgi:hypothetical protein